MSKYIYGLDISWSTGVAVFDLEIREHVYICTIDVNNIKLNKNEKEIGILEHGKRLRKFSDTFKEIIQKYPPSVIAIERYFSRFNNSTVALSKIHGVVNEIASSTPQIYYPPKTVKETICRGDATKKYVRETIEKVYPNIQFQNEDESDSFAVALTYLIKNKYIQWDKNEIKKMRGKKKDD